jgi:hypothetical protein
VYFAISQVHVVHAHKCVGVHVAKSVDWKGKREEGGCQQPNGEKINSVRAPLENIVFRYFIYIRGPSMKGRPKECEEVA